MSEAMRRDLLILSYHTASPSWPSPLAVEPQRLEGQLRMLLRRGYRPATLDDAANGPPAARALAVTFDDAFATVFQHARPVLAGLGIPGTVFVPTDYPERCAPMAWPGIDHWVGGEHDRELLPMTWAQLRELARDGWEIGSHTCSHPRLTQLSDAALERELTDSRARIEQEIARPCLSLAYPFGVHDDRVVAATRAAGYRNAVTVPDDLRATDALRRPRIGVYRTESPSSFRMKVSPLARALRRTPLAGTVTRTTRGVLRRLRS